MLYAQICYLLIQYAHNQYAQTLQLFQTENFCDRTKSRKPIQNCTFSLNPNQIHILILLSRMWGGWNLTNSLVAFQNENIYDQIKKSM